MAAKPRRAGELDQLRREVIGVDRAEPQPGGSDRLEQSLQERCQGLPTLSAEGAEIDPAEHDLAIPIGDRPAGPLDEVHFLPAARGPSRSPDDAVGAAMVAAILHLEEESGTRERRRAGSRPRGEVRRNVVEDLALSRVREGHVRVGDGGYAWMRVVDMTAGQDEVGLRMTAAQPVHHRAEFAVRLGGDRAAVDHADVGVVCRVRYREADTGQPVAQLCHLGKIDLASQRLDRHVHRCWTRIAAATMGASRARRIRGPRLTARPPRSRNVDSSLSVHPPSGPTAIAYADELSSASSRDTLAVG